MNIDWNVVATIAAPVLTLVIGALLTHLIEARPKMIAFLGHVSGIKLMRGGSPLIVNSHSIVLRNSGRQSANNVRVGHRVLSDFQVVPDIDYTVTSLPDGGSEIKFPVIVPQKQITITYLYFPPLTWEQINTHLETDNGPIKVINTIPTVQLPKWIIRIAWAFMIIGCVSMIYTIYELVNWII